MTVSQYLLKKKKKKVNAKEVEDKLYIITWQEEKEVLTYWKAFPKTVSSLHPCHEGNAIGERPCATGSQADPFQP